jgi:hypothetical protein
MAWYAIRRVVLFEVKQNGMNVFEERIVAIRANSSIGAHEKTRKEAKDYARRSNLKLARIPSGTNKMGRSWSTDTRCGRSSSTRGKASRSSTRIIIENAGIVQNRRPLLR